MWAAKDTKNSRMLDLLNQIKLSREEKLVLTAGVPMSELELSEVVPGYGSMTTRDHAL